MTDPIDLTPAPASVPGPAEPVPGVPKARRRWVATSMVAVLAVAAGAFGVSILAAGDGADSPGGAVDALFDAIDHEDVIGVVEALDPQERRILRPAVEDTGTQAKRVKVASDDLDLRQVEGVDLRVQDLAYRTEPLGDGLVAVDLTGGHVDTSADLDRMPYGSTIADILARDEGDDGGRPDRKADDRIDLDGIRLVAVQRDGGWHVSALYSIAEQIRRDASPVPAVPDFGHGIAAKGASSPEAAVRDAVTAATHGDVRRLIELTPSGEMDVLHDYGPILVDAAGDDSGMPSGIEVSDLELEVTDGADGTKVVSPTSFTMTTSDDYEQTVSTYDGRCTTYSYTYTEKGRSEYGDDLGGMSEQKYCEDDTVTTLSPFSSVNPFFFGIGGGNDLRVVTEEHDGAWFVSPTRSLLESTVGRFRDLSPDDAKRTARWWAGDYWVAEPDALWKACGVAKPSLDASSAAGEKAAATCYEKLPDSYDGPRSGWYGYGGESGGFTEGTSSDKQETSDDLDYSRCEHIYVDAEADTKDLSDAEFRALDEAFQNCLDAAEDPTSTGPASVPMSPQTTVVGPARPTTPNTPPASTTTTPVTPTTAGEPASTSTSAPG